MAPDDDFFAAPRFGGDRFDERHAELPVDVLPALTTYGNLLLELARELYRLRFNRSNAPAKRFKEAFQLNLVAIKDGSARAQLARRAHHLDELPLDDQFGPFLEEARELLNAAVQAANEDKEFPARFPTEFVPQLMKLVDPLAPGEYIQLVTPKSPQATAPRVSHGTRERLARRKIRRVTGERILTGAIVGVDTATNQMKLRLDGGTTLEGKYSPVHEETFISLLALKRLLRVTMKVAAVLDVEGNPASIDEVVSLSVWTRSTKADVSKVESRIEALKALQQGWLGGRAGQVASSLDLNWAREFLLRLMVDHGLPVPRIFPTEDGGVRAEWSNGPWEVSLDIEFPDRGGWIHAAQIDDESQDREGTFNLMKDEEDVVALLASVLPQSQTQEGI